MEISFKTWIIEKHIFNEVAELVKPISKISKAIIIKNKGTWKERPVIQYKFTTSIGNVVKVHFEKFEDFSYDVMFYVNDNQYDNSSSTKDHFRDFEILGNVLWLIKQKLDKLKVKKFTFIAQTGERDTKIVRGLDINKYKQRFFFYLNQLKDSINSYNVKMIEPNYDLYKKFNKPIPLPKPDVDKDLFIKIFKTIENLVNSNSSLEDILNNTYSQFENLNKFIDTTEFLKSFRDLSNAIESNSSQGWRRHLNRREIVWEKLMRKYFPDWNISKFGSKFELTKK